MIGAATEKARLPRFSLVLGIESCCEVDDLSCLGTLEKCACDVRAAFHQWFRVSSLSNMVSPLLCGGVSKVFNDIYFILPTHSDSHRLWQTYIIIAAPGDINFTLHAKG